MKLYWVKTNWLIKKLFRNYKWDVSNNEKKVYLTFDDGPIPEATSWVLEELLKYNAKATFFCIGDNIQKHPELFEKISEAGHSVGNHSYNHLNGWKTQTKTYLENIKRCEDEIYRNDSISLHKKLFRPPYGKIKLSQSRALRSLGYEIVMWDVLSADFDTEITNEKCLDNVLSNIKPGSIVVFHDSIKAFKNLEYALPKTLEYLKANGFTCEVL